MKLSKLLATITLVTCFMASTAFAAPETTNQGYNGINKDVSDSPKEKKDCKCKKHEWDKKMLEEFRKDPIKALENRKAEVQALVKEGKITKEKADIINAKLDEKIKKINEFNKLSLKEKKEKLIGSKKIRLEQKVKEGKLTQDKADKIIKKYAEKVEEWDGKGYPKFFEKGFRKNK